MIFTTTIRGAEVELKTRPSSQHSTGGRTIAILAWGSLIGEPHRGDIKLAIARDFQKTPLQFPIGLRRVSKKDTDDRYLSLVIASGEPSRTIWFVPSSLHALPEARNNLAKREGMPNRDKISYIRKLHGHMHKEREEKHFVKHWVGRQGNLSDSKIKELIEWAEKSEFDAAIWTGLDANVSAAEAEELLNKDVKLVKNTQNYIKKLPQPYTDVEQAIIKM